MFRKVPLAFRIISKNFSSFCRSGNWIPEFVMGVQIGTDDFKLLEFCLLRSAQSITTILSVWLASMGS